MAQYNPRVTPLLAVNTGGVRRPRLQGPRRRAMGTFQCVLPRPDGLEPIQTLASSLDEQTTASRSWKPALATDKLV